MLDSANELFDGQHEAISPSDRVVQYVLFERSVYEKYFKRFFDVLISVILLISASPVLLITAVLIRLESPGPAIFRQERLGLNGRKFIIYKFRSMRNDAESAGPRWASVDDDRTTRLGRFLRKSHLDELPQLLNILHGDMSIVGPRPEREYFYCKFEKTIPDFRCRLCVKPGLTGLAQVNGGYDMTPLEKLTFDKGYIQSASFLLDCKICLKTIWVVLQGKGAR